MKKINFEDVFNLELFATRFGIPKEDLAWGLIVSQAGEVTTYFPAIMIKGENLYINLCSDSLAPLVNACGCTQKIYEADVKDLNSDNLAFVAGNNAATLNKDAFFSIYRTKIMNSELAKEAKRLM